MTTHRIIIGDSRSMNKVADRSVQLIVTSPPYWQLKDYGTDEQIGFHDCYESYINHLNLVWLECYRVLSDGCRMCVNIGDQFARSAYYGRYKVIPIRSEIIRFCETLGMDYMGAVIWRKTTSMHTSGGGAVMGSFPYPRNGILKMDYEFILLFKKPGQAPKPTAEQKQRSAMTKDEWNVYFASHWTFPGVRQSGHLAMFPEELPKRLIRMFSFEGETVLDPFLGSGTTSLAARRLHRNSIGYEINPAYEPLIREKLTGAEADASGDRITFTEDTGRSYSLDALPYRFHDPHRMERKPDTKNLRFGSKIDGTEAETESLFGVKRVLSPETLELNTGLIIKLLGIKENPAYRQQAIAYLQNKFRKRRIYLRYDKTGLDASGYPLCYVYLDNRTFINRHLIRTGFVDVVTDMEYACKRKFLDSVPASNFTLPL
ncbi:MAG: site-specific DNA-methyltransferase [Oscillibacter sp.]|nr:site-specific DNA-methyltransferase [Oscillibacter sp.]